MQDTKVLSPEVVQLIETIQKQTQDYTQAFANIKLEQDEIVRQRRMLSQIADDLNNSMVESVKSSKVAFFDLLNMMEVRSEKTLKIYDELQSILEYKDSFAQLQGTLQKRLDDAESMMSILKDKIDSEFPAMESSLKTAMEKSVEAESKELEQKVVNTIKRYDGRFANLDQKLHSLVKSFDKDMIKTNDEIEQMRVKLSGIKIFTEDLQQMMDVKLSAVGETISINKEQFRELKSKSNEKQEKQDKTDVTHLIYEPGYVTSTKDIDILKGIIRNLTDKQTELSNKLNITYIISAILGLLVLVAFLVR